jgi:hypothetical protein
MKTMIKKHLVEGTLIVFSVLFALFINKSFENYQTNRKRAIAEKSIIKELQQNQYILNRWKEKHIEVRNRISSVINGESDSLRSELEKFDYLNLGVLTNNESLVDAILTSTAWESAKTTGIISEFDYETIQMLTQVYTLQANLSDRTLIKILDYYFDSEAHDMTNLNKTLVQFHLRFWELTGQEELMSTLYDNAITKLKK